MTATYNNTLLTPRDRIRHAIGDMQFTALDTTGALRQDEEYDAVMGLYLDWRIAAAVMAESLASEYAQAPDSFSASGDMSVSWKDRISTWLQTARQMRSEVAAESSATSAYSLVSSAPERDYPIPSEYIRR